ncbi:hypothetical protein TWF696_004261 [Orbilia brochopaga]|uniref:Uncharacterized protein n=1 Tax=Orbilia brochopaga TaxID=3140254 RepID=A0AAV9V6D5_9PEZI
MQLKPFDNIFITFALIFFAFAQQILAAAIPAPQCNNGIWDPKVNSCRDFSNAKLAGAAPKIKARGMAKTKTLRRKSEMVVQMKRAVQARARK